MRIMRIIIIVYFVICSIELGNLCEHFSLICSVAFTSNIYIERHLENE